MAPRIVILWKHDPGSFPPRCFQDQLNERTTALLQVRIRKDKTGNWGRVSIRYRIHWPQPLFQPTLPPAPISCRQSPAAQADLQCETLSGHGCPHTTQPGAVTRRSTQGGVRGTRPRIHTRSVGHQDGLSSPAGSRSKLISVLGSASDKLQGTSLWHLPPLPLCPLLLPAPQPRFLWWPLGCPCPCHCGWSHRPEVQLARSLTPGALGDPVPGAGETLALQSRLSRLEVPERRGWGRLEHNASTGGPIPGPLRGGDRE